VQEKKEKKEKKHTKEKHKKGKKVRHERGGGSGSLPAGVEPITADEDYFRRTAEFQRWLQESRGQFLDELPSAEAHKLFAKFVSKWNDGELSAAIYRLGADAADLQRTRHRWAFSSQLSKDEQLQLESARDSIHAQTQRAAGQGRDGAAIARAEAGAAGGGTKRQRDEAAAAFDEAAAMLGVHTSKPDAGSREALLEKRAAQTAYHRRNDDDDGVPALSESALMGASSEELATRMGKRHDAAARKSQHASARMLELEAKEKERMDSFKRQMGLPM